jgi:hypothetical protein
MTNPNLTQADLDILKLSTTPRFYDCPENNTSWVAHSNTVNAWLAYAFFAGILGLLAGIMTTYYG